ncbi:hypothetical protein AU255_17910 [Methyloprofundus sedimenti]|uniref:Uncharacterized protein n=1 Tax=Methyloprofundus sedimenti TaxID=1420851 RepID=A0A1V8M1A8_9GAMM|nr:hypothetical protein [Methyloprofundus sedimenti]OQK15347.1 hypothetical protein AU255_17910 [Methyloprofundus sedimenti]
MFIRQQDKRNELTLQMLERVGIKFFVLFLFILMFDPLWSGFLVFIDIIFELFHLVFEFFEYSLEVLVEHAFDANRHHGEIIVVNGVIAILLYGLFRLYRATPRLYIQFKHFFRTIWLSYLERKSAYWRSLSLDQKSLLILSYFIGIFSLAFAFVL